MAKHPKGARTDDLKRKEGTRKPEKRAKEGKKEEKINYVKLFKEIPQRVPFTGKPRSYTVSVSLPVSLIENVQGKCVISNPFDKTGHKLIYIQTEELRAYVIGNIARSLTIYGVNEVVIYNDTGDKNTPWMYHFALNLRYLETPQYLRKFLFPMDPVLKYSGLQNPVNAPHHLRSTEWLPYREGVVRLIRKGSTYTTLYADCGIFSSVEVLNKEDLAKFYGLEYETEEEDDIYQRVTVRLDEQSISKCHQLWKEGKSLDSSETGALSGYLVDPEEPLKVAGLYWGYVVRECDSFPESLEGCPFNDSGTYDLKLGTGVRGELYTTDTKLPKFKNMLVCFGPVLGLEHLMDDPSKSFHKYYNFCNQQKSRTIRTEEALMMVLSILSFTKTF